MANTYAKDNQIRISIEFLVNGVDTDPSTIKCFYKDPNNVVTTLVYGVDGALVKDGVGKYHVDIYASLVGFWYYRFEGSGSLISANESTFYISQSQIL